MGKRSDFQRMPRDLYDTPPEAVVPLLPHLLPGTRFIEPCAGNGKLLDELERHGHKCVWAFDIEPRCENGRRGDALTRKWDMLGLIFITNPPWSRDVLHPMIINLADQAPTWLLLDADWAHTRQSSPFMARCRRIVAVGRVKWIPDSKFTGKDNACWYLFGQALPGQVPAFYGRTP